jgi:hypothetical protein
MQVLDATLNALGSHIKVLTKALQAEKADPYPTNVIHSQKQVNFWCTQWMLPHRGFVLLSTERSGINRECPAIVPLWQSWKSFSDLSPIFWSACIVPRYPQ